MNILEGLEIFYFKGDILKPVSCSNPFLYNITEPKNKLNDMGHENSRLSNFQFFFTLSSHFYLLISQLPDIVQKFFCTPDGAMYPTFRIEYIPSRFLFNLMEINKR